MVSTLWRASPGLRQGLAAWVRRTSATSAPFAPFQFSTSSALVHTFREPQQQCRALESPLILMTLAITSLQRLNFGAKARPAGSGTGSEARVRIGFRDGRYATMVGQPIPPGTPNPPTPSEISAPASGPVVQSQPHLHEAGKGREPAIRLGTGEK